MTSSAYGRFSAYDDLQLAKATDNPSRWAVCGPTLAPRGPLLPDNLQQKRVPDVFQL